MNNNTNMWVMLGAAVIGAMTAAAVFIVDKYTDNKYRTKHRHDIVNLHKELEDLRVELEKLRALRKKKNEFSNKPINPRGRTQSNASSVASTRPESYRSDSDDEFYDCSSDEAETEKSDYLLPELTDIDDVLQDKSSNKELEEALKKLNKLNECSSENPELLWRVAKARKILALKSNDDKVKQKHITEGLKSARLAVKISPKSADCHKFLAVLLGLQAASQGNSERITSAKEMSEHLAIALKLTPNDPALHHMMGRYAYEIAQLSWWERAAAQALYAALPYHTLSEAMQYFMDAEKLCKYDWKENKLYIAKCSLAIGERTSGIEWLEKAELSESDESPEVHEEVKSLLQKYR